MSMQISTGQGEKHSFLLSLCTIELMDCYTVLLIIKFRSCGEKDDNWLEMEGESTRLNLIFHLQSIEL